MVGSGSRDDARDWPVIPALADGLLTLTNAELVAHGYPPRPDPAQSPSHFAQWRQLVSRPWARVGDRRVERDDVSFALPLPPQQADAFSGPSDNWSGAECTENGPPKSLEFFYLTGTWNVPVVVAGLPGSPVYSAAAEWVGFQADKLFQSGSDSEAWNLTLGLEGGTWIITNYWTWIQSYPDPPCAIPYMWTSPGDEMQVIIFLADEAGNTRFTDGDGGGLAPGNNKVWFMVYNFTKGTSYWGTLDAVGWFGSANFIVERPNALGTTAALANFGVARMTKCSFANSDTGWRLMYPLGSTGSSVSYVNMQSKVSGDILDVVAPLPAPDGKGYDLFFFWQDYG